MRAYNLFADIVRRSHCSEVGRSAVNNKAVTVTYAGVKSELFIAEMLLNTFHYLARFLCGDIAGRVINHCFAFIRLVLGKGDKVAAQGDIIITKINSDADRFKR